MTDFDTTTPRGAIAARIQAAHPAWTVVARPDGPDHLARGRTYVACYRTTLTKANGAPALTHSVTLDLYAAATLTDAAEATLDDRLDELLTTVAAMNDLVWQDATRTSFDSFHGWRITLAMHSPDVYAQAARAATT